MRAGARSESTQEETRASIATSSDSFTWWDNDYDYYRCEIVSRFKKLIDELNVNL